MPYPKCVAYDRNASDDYEPLLDALKRMGGKRRQYSLWEIDDPRSPRVIGESLQRYFDAGDRLEVFEINTATRYVRPQEPSETLGDILGEALRKL